MSIWKREVSLDQLNIMTKGTMDQALGLIFTDFGDDYLKAEMEIGPNNRQPFGLLHGGASCAMAETLGSVASNGVIDDDKVAVGMDLQAHHVRPAIKGKVTGIVRPVHLGKTTHLWNIIIRDQNDRELCHVNFRTAVIPKKSLSEKRH